MKALRSVNVLIAVLFVVVGALQLGIHYRKSQVPPVVWTPADMTVIDLKGMPVEGSPLTTTIIVEFSDYECPYCALHATGVGLELQKRFVSTQLVRHAFANNPLASHPHARMLAAAAWCAGTEGQYWQMHHALFTEQPNTLTQVAVIAKRLSLNVAALEGCINGDKAHYQIQKDTEQAKSLGLFATPGFAIGEIQSDGTVRVEKLITGAQPFSVFSDALNLKRLPKVANKG